MYPVSMARTTLQPRRVLATPQTQRVNLNTFGNNAIKLVIVEDNAGDQYLIKDALSRNYSNQAYKLFGTPIEAFNHIKNSGATHLLTDFEMPGYNGLQLIEKIRAEVDEDNQPTNIMMQTTSTLSPANRKKANELRTHTVNTL